MRTNTELERLRAKLEQLRAKLERTPRAMIYGPSRITLARQIEELEKEEKRVLNVRRRERRWRRTGVSESTIKWMKEGGML
jgi:hypothetical protein